MILLSLFLILFTTICFIFCLDRVSCGLGWLSTHSIAKDVPELLILLPLIPKCWECRHVPPYLAQKGKKCKKYVVLKLGLWKLIPFEISWRTLREHNSYTLKRQKQHSKCKQTNTKAKTCEDFLFTNLSLNDMVFKVLYVDVIFCTVPLSLSTLQLESYCGFYCSKCSLERFLMCSGKQLSNK